MMVMMVVMPPMAMVVSVSVVTVLMIVLMLMLGLMSLVVMLMPLAETMPFVFVLMYHSCSGKVCPNNVLQKYNYFSVSPLYASSVWALESILTPAQ